MANIELLMPMIKQFMPFAQKRMGFRNPPQLFLKGDTKNAKNPLAKTAYYDPENMSVTVYTTDRHPKDIMRSLSHELVHHAQNCRGEFDKPHQMGDGYAQNDSHMREMEREAYEVGNLCFRDWEDGIKHTIYFEHLQKGDSIMSTKDWKNGEIKSLLSEAWGFKMDLSKLNESVEEELEEGVPEVKASELDDDDVKDGPGDMSVKDGKLVKVTKEEEEIEEGAASSGRQSPHPDRNGHDPRKRPMEEAEVSAFGPNHYCVHHGGVQHEGEIKMAEAVQHAIPDENGHVSHYDMRLEDGTILENVALEDIQVTNASLALEHSHTGGKRGTKKRRKAVRMKEEDEVVSEDFPGKSDMDTHKRDLSEERLREIIAYALKTKG